MKKNRLLTLILALAMTLTLVLPMSSLAAGENAALTINAPASYGLTAGDFTAYKLFNATVSGTNYSYTPVAAVSNFLSAYPTYAPDLKAYLAGTPDMDALNKDLTAFAGTGGFNATAVSAAQNGTNSVQFTGLDYGYYLVVGEATIDGQKVTSYSNIITVDKAAVTADIKADAPSIDKYVSDTNLAANSPNWAKETDVNIGDPVYFKITSAVPNMTGYSSYSFIAHDTLDAGLSLASGFSKSDVTVTIGGTSYTDFTVGVSGQNLTVTFGDTFIDQTEGAPIVILYAAKLNGNAVIAPNSNKNTVLLEYSNNPYVTTDTGKTPPAVVDVYTFKLDLYKYDGKTNLPLAGAEFTLSPSGGSPIALIKIDNYNYRVAMPGETGTTVSLVSPDNGKIKIVGLDAGTYTLSETKAPNGYNAVANKTIVITHSGAGVYTVKVDSGTAVDGVAAQVDIENNSGSIFPGTGGIGTTIFYVVSAFLTIGLIAFFVARRRRNLLKVK